MEKPNLNGADVVYGEGVIFIKLPIALWRSCGPCHCHICKGAEGFWDTLAVSAKRKPKSPSTEFAWTVHYPALHSLQYENLRRTEGSLL